VGSNTRIIGPVAIGSGTSIGNNVLIGPYTSIGNQCTLMDDVKIFSSSIYDGVTIGVNTTVSGSTIDNDTHVGDDCSLENDTVIGPRVILEEGVVVHSRTRIWPDVVVAGGTIVKEHVLNEKYDIRCEGS